MCHTPNACDLVGLIYTGYIFVDRIGVRPIVIVKYFGVSVTNFRSHNVASASKFLGDCNFLLCMNSNLYTVYCLCFAVKKFCCFHGSLLSL